MSRWILIALILFTVSGMHPAPVTAAESQTIETCWHEGRLRPVPGRWYKVASRIDDDWTGFGDMANQLAPEPGMPQALGFESWQAVYDDIASGTGMITDVGLWYSKINFGGQFTTSFVQFPASLIPEGKPSIAQHHRWYYFPYGMRDYFGRVDLAMVRFQHEGGPIITFDAGMDFPWDVEFALYVKM